MLPAAPWGEVPWPCGRGRSGGGRLDDAFKRSKLKTPDPGPTHGRPGKLFGWRPPGTGDRTRPLMRRARSAYGRRASLPFGATLRGSPAGAGEGLRPFDPLGRPALRCGVRVRPAADWFRSLPIARGLAAPLAPNARAGRGPRSRPRHRLPLQPRRRRAPPGIDTGGEHDGGGPRGAHRRRVRGTPRSPAASAVARNAGGSKGGAASPCQTAMVESGAGAVPLGYAASSARFRVGSGKGGHARVRVPCPDGGAGWRGAGGGVERDRPEAGRMDDSRKPDEGGAPAPRPAVRSCA